MMGQGLATGASQAAYQGAGNLKILSTSQCDYVDAELDRFKAAIEKYCEEIEGAIQKFNNNEIVKSFYQSGNFGIGAGNEILKLKEGVVKYYEIISGASGLIPVTKSAIQNYRDNLNRSYRGGV